MATPKPQGRTVKRQDQIDDTDRHAWEQPGVLEVAPGVHRVPLPIPEAGLHAVNVYVLEGDDGLTLVDAGWAMAESRSLIVDALDAMSHTLRDIRSILVTHVHVDHYSQGVTLRRETGCDLRLGEGERASVETLRAGTEADGATQLAQLRRHGAAAVLEALQGVGYGSGNKPDMWELPDGWIVDGQTFAAAGTELKALHTPGHTSGHMVFDAADRDELFTGDHVLPMITPSIGYESRGSALPLEDYLSSLTRVLDRPDRMMLPAHGPVRSSVHIRAKELLAHHEERLGACAAHLASQGSTAFQVAQRLGWTRRLRRLDALDPVSQMLAVCETAAHLDVLALRGQVAREGVGDVVVYQPVPVDAQN
jgi:glyoxylase-like metal-dependent hydrolase (beta-lactamase superfamily II)